MKLYYSVCNFNTQSESLIFADISMNDALLVIVTVNVSVFAYKRKCCFLGGGINERKAPRARRFYLIT